MFELDAYLERIGLDGRPALEQAHRAHTLSVPFENLDPQRGVVPTLTIDSLQAKLVTNRRGGYCFEQNLLFAAVLEALGYEVEPMLARVRWGMAPDHINSLTHLVLRATRGGSSWLADVGFGSNTLLEAIPFGPGGPYEQAGWLFRMIEEEEDQLVLQADTSDGWRDVYAFFPRRVELVDINLSNWYVATWPDSRFRTGLIASANRTDGTRIALSDWSGELEYVERTPSGRTATPVTRAEIPELLAERFGLPGFAVDADGRVVPTA
jgi:N-hydroxyarylamine O-acetyltransferase